MDISTGSEKRLSGEERKLSIAQAATPLFAEKGFRGVTTKELARAAGVSEALLYKHFPSKEALYDSIQDFCCANKAQILDGLRLLKPNTSSLVMAIYMMMKAIFLGMGDPVGERYLKKLIMHSLLEDGTFARAFIQARLDEWLPKFQELVQSAIDEGHLEADGESRFDQIWFCHHLSLSLSLMFLSEKPIIDYDCKKPELFQQSVLFALRGMGLTKEAISQFYNPEAFELMMNNSIQEDGE